MVLLQKTKGFLNLEIEDDSKVIIDYYNKNCSLPSSIILVMEDIQKLSHDLNIYNYCHIYKKANKATDYLSILIFGSQNF